MCGIIGYISQKDVNIADTLIAALKRMEYRGYDSAGIAAFCDGKIELVKTVGEPKKLIQKCRDLKRCQDLKWQSHLGIGHTRWATHGGVNEINAHPHCDGSGKIFVAHNGTIDNYRQLKKMLINEGKDLVSQTDTEVIPFLIARFFALTAGGEQGLIEAFKETLSILHGAYGLVMIHEDYPDLLLAARLGSPVIIGQGKEEVIVASDPLAIASYTKQVYYLNDGEMAVVRANDFDIIDAKNCPVSKELQELEIKIEDLDQNGFPHFMLKEIFDQPVSISDVIAGRLLKDNVKLGGLENHTEILRKAKRVVLVGCGTAFYAAKVGEYLLEEIAGIPTKCEKGSEFACREPVFDEDSVYFFISQSGETADTIQALKKVKAKGLPAFGIVNISGSTIARETDAGVYCRVGTEIAVASTKAFTGQITVLVMLAIMLGRQRRLSPLAAANLIHDLSQIPSLIKKVLAKAPNLRKIAKDLLNYPSVMFLGRKYNYPIALEGALKLKEIAYVATEGFPSGEMKHGPIAMVSDKLPSVFIIPNDSVKDNNLSNLQEIKARNGIILAIASDGDNDLFGMANYLFTVPKISEPLVPLLTAVPLQLLAYYSAVLRGHNVDKPRNLAKSVTVV